MKTILIVVSFLFACFLSSCKYFNTVDPEEKNVELQKLEIDIQRKISDGDKNGALDLLKELVHPSSEQWIEKQKQTDMDHFMNGGNQYYTYNEWWSERREQLQKEISLMDNSTFKKDSSSSSRDELSDENTILNSGSIGNETVASESKDLPANLIGLYVMQFANGSTKFYKFFKDAKGITGVVYQDNVSGNVRVENYMLQSFNESTNEVILESKKNPGSLSKVRFMQEQESENGFKLMDSEGATYSLVGN